MKWKRIAIIFTCFLFLIFIVWFVFPRHFRFVREASPSLSEDSRIRGNDNGIEQIMYSPTLPTLDTIFSNDHTWVATLSAEKITRILVTGDIIPARSVNHGVITRSNPLWPYEKVAAAIDAQQADIIFANLETPLIRDCPITQTGMVFCGSDRNIEGLKYIHVDLASLANNHAANHGAEGVQETIQSLQVNGIEPVGINGAVIKEIHGVKFAFLGYNDISVPQSGVANAEEELIAREIREARQKADVVIVMYHWGAEYRSQPDDRQIYLAHYTIDRGADYVLSNHPHWIQPVEIYKNKLIMYAHGNFIFDQMWSQKTREGVLGMYTFYEDQLIDVYFLPLQINDFGQAVFMEGTEKQRILEEIKRESQVLEASK